MTRAFVVTINLDDSANLDTVAAELADVLASEGFEVNSVNPWDSAASPTSPAPVPFPKF